MVLMSDKNSKIDPDFFLLLSILFWGFVILMSVLWEPAYQLMQQIIRMRPEYSLVEQGSKFLLLVMLCTSILAYSNQNDTAKLRLATVYVLFALALYFAESNFVSS